MLKITEYSEFTIIVTFHCNKISQSLAEATAELQDIYTHLLVRGS